MSSHEECEKGIIASHVDDSSITIPVSKETNDIEDDVTSEAVGGRVEDLPKGYYRSTYFIGTVIAMAFGSCASYTGWVLPSNLVGIINQDIGPDASYIWLATVNTLSIAVTCLIYGRLSDIFGRRWFIVVGNGIGFVGALMGAFAPNIKVLIGANTLMGIAASPQLCFVFVGVELVPNKYRGYLNGLMFLASLPFAAFGTVIARSMAANTPGGWRTAYYMNCGLTGAATLLFYFFYHPPTFEMLHAKRTKMEILKTLDLLGLVLVSSGLTLFLLGISWGGQQYPWKSGQVIGSIVGGVFLFVMFVVYEIWHPTPYPLIPMHLFKNRGYLGLIFAAAAGSMIYYSMGVLWPTQVGILYTQDPIMIGWHSCIIGSGVLIGQTFAGGMLKVVGKQKWQLVVSACGMTAVLGAMASTNQHTHTTAVALATMAGVFVGYLELAALTLAPFCLAPGDIGMATNLLAATRSAFASIALSVYITLLNNKMATNIPKLVGPAAVSAGLPEESVPSLLSGFASGNFSLVEGLSSDILTTATSAYQTASSNSFRVVYLTSIAFGCLGIIAALNSPNLEGSFDDNVSRKLHAGKKAEKRPNEGKEVV